MWGRSLGTWTAKYFADLSSSHLVGLKAMRLWSAAALLLLLLPALGPALLASAPRIDRSVSMYIVAVSNTPNGTVGSYSLLQARVACPGSGHVYIETRPLTSLDTQASSRIAAMVAARVAGVDFYSCDYFVSIVSNASIVGGPSASGAVAVGLALALMGLRPNTSVVMTGMINVDGTIGPVGGLVEKLEAAKEAGAKLFLIPAGQLMYPRVVVERRQVGPMVIERSRVVYVNLSRYGEELGVEVREVSSIYDALRYFAGIAPPTPGNASLDRLIPAEQRRAMEGWASQLSMECSKNLKVFEDYRRSLPPRAVRALEPFYNSSVELLRRVEEVSDPYIAATYAYRALINATYLRLVAEAYREGVLDVVGNVTARVQGMLKRYREELRGAEPNNIYRLSVMLNVWSRVAEAESSLSELLNALRSGACSYSPSTCLYRAAVLYARAYSIEGWLELLDLGVRAPAVSMRGIEDVSKLLLDAASTEVSYAKVLSGEVGKGSGYIALAEEMLGKAVEARNTVERLAYALRALIYSSLSMHDMFTIEKGAAARALRGNALALLKRIASQGAFVAANYLYIKLGDEYMERGDVSTALYLYEEASFLASLYSMLITGEAPPPSAKPGTATPATQGAATVTHGVTITVVQTVRETHTETLVRTVTVTQRVVVTKASGVQQGVPLAVFTGVVAALAALWILSLAAVARR